jgi:hypothetical protein
MKAKVGPAALMAMVFSVILFVTAAQASEATQTGGIWATDPSYTYKIPGEGTEIKSIPGGGNNLDVDPNDGSVWMGGSLHKLNSNGEHLLTKDEYNVNNISNEIAVDPNNGNVWLTTADKKLVKLAPDGTQLLNIGGFVNPSTVDVDPRDGSVWMIDFIALWDGGGNVIKYDSTGNELFRLTGSYLCGYGPPVEVDPNNGSAWVGGCNRVWKFDSKGNQLLSLYMRSYFDNWTGTNAISLDPRDGSIWVGDHNGNILKLDSSGGEIHRKTSMYWPVVDPSDGSVWVQDNPNHALVKFDSIGVELRRLGNGYQNPFSWPIPQAMVYEIPLGPPNHPPTASAGDNIMTSSEELSFIIIYGSATDEDLNDILNYRWKDGETILLDWTPVDGNGNCPLDLSTISYLFDIGAYTLTLEVADEEFTSTDEMVLTIENSPPNASPSGAGIYQVNNLVSLSGDVSDFDGDVLEYKWIDGTNLLFSGTIQAIEGGDPIEIPAYETSSLCIGVHAITLEVDDGINAPVSRQITIEIIDDLSPTLAPVVNKNILWPPDHRMVDIVLWANASDNSGLPVHLSATIASNEPIEDLGDGETEPDFTEPAIDQDNGIISLQLRAERSGGGSGRIYLITVTATDESGNVSTAEVEIIVPHDKMKM